MSDQISQFDEVFREKLSEHTISPPDLVWEKIESKRSFGHVVANKISINWRTFGTMLLLLLGGGSSAILFGGEEQKLYFPISQYEINGIDSKFENEPKSKELVLTYSKSENLDQTNSEKTIVKTDITQHKLNSQERLIPDLELLASVEQAGFSRPNIASDPKLNAFLQELDGWESAKPKSFIRYYQLDEISSLGIHKRELEQSILFSDELDDYVRVKESKKTFKDKASFIVSFTPQTITKSMVAKYNLSSSYLRHRQNSEQTRMAYTFEANLHYELNNFKFIETGLNYTQIYEEMSFKGEKRFSNQYNFIEIPLLLGFEDRNSKWGYQVKGGLGIQIFNSYDGYIYKIYEDNGSLADPFTSGNYRMKKGNAVKTIISGDHTLSKNQDPDEVLDLSKKEENPFKSNGVVNIHLSTGLTYYHSVKTTFIIAPYYRRNINSITKESALFNEKISYMGIAFGTRFSF